MATAATGARGVAVEELTRRRGGRFDRLLYFLKRDRMALAGLAIVALVFFLMVFSSWLVPYDPITADATHILLPPSGSHLFGTDNLGMDIFSRVIYAPRIDLLIALLSTVLAVAIGVPLGVISGYYRGVGAEAISRVAD